MFKAEQFREVVRYGKPKIPPALDQSAESVREYEYATRQKAERNYYANDMSVVKPFFCRRFHTLPPVKTKYPITAAISNPSSTHIIRLNVFITVSVLLMTYFSNVRNR